MSLLSSSNLYTSLVGGGVILLYDMVIDKSPTMTAVYDAGTLALSILVSKQAVDMLIPANVMTNLFGGMQNNSIFKPLLVSIITGFLYDYVYNGFLRPKNNLLAQRARDKNLMIGIGSSYIALMFANLLMNYFMKSPKPFNGYAIFNS